MSVPISRNRTYVDGVTQIPAGDMNDMQDAQVNEFVSYEFMERWDIAAGALTPGAAIADLAKRWDYVRADGSQSATVKVPDSGYSARSVELDAGSAGVGAQHYLVTANPIIYPGTATVRLLWPAVVVASSANAQEIHMGIVTVKATPLVEFWKYYSQTNWYATTDGTGTNADTGVPPVIGTWQWFMLELTNGTTAKFYINNALVATVAYAYSGAGPFYLHYSGRDVNAGNNKFRVGPPKMRWW